MAKSGKFYRFLDNYNRVVWAVIGTLLLVCILACAVKHSCLMNASCKSTFKFELRK